MKATGGPLALTVLIACLNAGMGRTHADRLELNDGTILDGCYVRDEGIRLLVWHSLDQVGGPAEIIPRSAVKEYTIDRGAEWDARPDLPDLSVIFIEMNPKLAGLHGRVNYDVYGRPSLGGAPALVDLGEDAVMHPEEAARNLKLKYLPGEPITLTAHVKNLGFATARPFRYVWLIDQEEIDRGEVAQALAETEETTLTLRWHWQEGCHHVTFRIITDQPEIATLNNSATDPLWGWGLVYIVHPERVKVWRQNRTAYGTFSFEDFYRWHLDLMNLLFAASSYPSAPAGIRARVRLDRIVYAEDVEAAAGEWAEDGLRYDQGRWIWLDDDDRNQTWRPPTHEWRNQTEWSLPHELGHQLGIVDYYVLDYPGHEDHVMPDNGDPISHFQNHPLAMMHWHGPHLWSEMTAGYLNQTWDNPRGHFGDYYFQLPAENYLQVVDVNGRPVADAVVEIFQRGAMVDPEGRPGSEEGVRHYPVLEDGNFDRPVSREPVIVGVTDDQGMLRLPNRPVEEALTLNGYQRRPNPFGNMNVVGQRGLMLARVSRQGRPCFFWLEITEFNLAYLRGERDRFLITLKTPYGSVDSPTPPMQVAAARTDGEHARITWQASPPPRAQHYLDRVIGYRVYRRIGSDGLNDRPWFPVATVGPETLEVTVDLREFPQDIYWFSKADRFAVSSIGELGIESELVETLLPAGEA